MPSWSDDDDFEESDSDEYVPDDQKDEEFIEELSDRENFQVSVRELEQDLDVMFQEQGEVLYVWPLVTICDLDRKLPSKMTKIHFEPLANGSIGNISTYEQVIERVELLSNDESRVDLNLSNDEQFIIQVLCQNHQLEMDKVQQEYKIIKNSILKAMEKDPLFRITLAGLKSISPTSGGLFLIELISLFKKFNIFKNDHSLSTTPEAIYEPRKVKIASKWECRSCTAYCMHKRYVLAETPSFQVCTRCFETGQFPFEYSSSMFEFRSGIAEIEDKEPLPEWTDDETLRLLEYVEEMNDWRRIAEKMKRPRYECILQFVKLEFQQSFDDDDVGMLKQMIGMAQNPVMSLIQVIAHAVHPGLASEIAKKSLRKLLELPEQQLTQRDVLWRIALEGWELCLATAQDVKAKEERLIQEYIDFLIASVHRRIELKVSILAGLLQGSKDDKPYTEALAQYMFDTQDDD